MRPQHDSDVVHAHRLDGEQRVCDIAEEHVRAWLLELALDPESHVGSGRGDFAHAFDGIAPEGLVVGLEGVVITVLPGPELDVFGAELTGDWDGALVKIDRLPTQLRIGVRQRTFLKLAAVAGRRDRIAANPVARKRRADLIDCHPLVEGIVDVEGHQVTDLSSPANCLQHADRGPVGIGGIAIDELPEHPQSRSKS